MTFNLLIFISQTTYASYSFINILTGVDWNKKKLIEKLIDIYNTFPTVNDIETGLMDLIMNNSAEQRNLILNSLHKELISITDTYKDNKTIFEGMEVSHIWDTDLLTLDKEIDKQLKKTRKASDEVREVSNSYEMTPFNGMPKDEIEILDKKLDKLTYEYNNEKEKLNKLYDERNSIKSLIRNIPDNLFKLVAQKCESIIPIVQKYIPAPIKVKDSNEKENIQSYFPMNVVSSIYEACNGKQFEEMSEIDFFHSINLLPNCKPLTSKKGEKTRICYLINQLSNTLSQEKKDQWLKDILKLVGIDYSFYRAKYRDVVGDLPSEANQEFTESLKEIFV